LYPIDDIRQGLLDDPKLRTLKFVLNLGRKKLDVEKPIEWVALLQGPSADNVNFWKKMETFPVVADKKREAIWRVSASGFPNSTAGLFLGIQFAPYAAETSVQLVSAGFEDQLPREAPARSAPRQAEPAPARSKPLATAPAPVARPSVQPVKLDAAPSPPAAPPAGRKAAPVSSAPKAPAGAASSSVRTDGIALLPLLNPPPRQPGTAPAKPSGPPSKTGAAAPAVTPIEAKRRGRVAVLPDSWICLFASVRDAQAGRIEFKAGSAKAPSVLTLDASACEQAVRLLRPLPEMDQLIRSLPKGIEQPLRLNLQVPEPGAEHGVNRIDLAAGTYPSETSMYLMSLAKRSVRESLGELQWDVALANDAEEGLHLFAVLQIAAGGSLRISRLELHPISPGGGFVLNGAADEVLRQG